MTEPIIPITNVEPLNRIAVAYALVQGQRGARAEARRTHLSLEYRVVILGENVRAEAA